MGWSGSFTENGAMDNSVRTTDDRSRIAIKKPQRTALMQKEAATETGC